MNRIIISIAAFGAVLIFGVSSSFACGISGAAFRGDGSKVDGTARVSTSWNSKTAFPKGGRYELDLGSSACGQKITVYVDGNHHADVVLNTKGMTSLDIVIRK